MTSALEKALKLLGHHARSEAEVRARLVRAGFTESEVAPVVERLKELRYLDDRAYAGARAERLLEAQQSPEAAALRIISAGVDAQVADEAVDAAREGLTERELAERALAKKHPKVNARSPHRERIRVGRWLVGKGFSEELARSLLALDDGVPPE